MSWRTNLGSLAQRVGLDPQTVTDRADRLLSEAHKLATSAEQLAATAVEQGLPAAKKLAVTAVEQGVPAAKKVAAQLQSAAQAAGTVADTLVTRARQRVKNVQLPAAPAKTTAARGTPDQGAKRTGPATPVAPPGPPAETASGGESPVSVRVRSNVSFDLSGLSITAADASELLRRPKSLDQAPSEALGPDEAKELRDYIAATPATIFATSERVHANAELLAERLRKPVVTPWRSVEAAAERLAAYDKQNGTDFVASSWIDMVRAWDRDEIPASAHEAGRSVMRYLRYASASPRGRMHAEHVCDALLAVARSDGWPTRLFEDAGDLDRLFDIVKRAAAAPDMQDAIAKKLFALAGAMMASPVSQSESGPDTMHPVGLRADVALRAADILDGLGKTSHQGLRAAALAAAASDDLRPGDSDLDAIERTPGWFVGPAFSGTLDAALEHARTAMTDTQARELMTFVAGTKGDVCERERRLQSFWRTPLICAELARHFGVDASPPVDGRFRPSLISAAAKVEGNVRRALAMLVVYDERCATRYSADAATKLLSGVQFDANARGVVAAARQAIARAGTSDDKRSFLDQTRALIERSAWPSLTTEGGTQATLALIAAAAEPAKSDATLANELFIVGYNLASTSVEANDAQERAVIAGAIARVGAELGRENDATMFTFLERSLKGETEASTVGA